MGMSRFERVGLIGDVHGEHEHLAKVLEYLEGHVDAVLCVGDIVDGLGEVERSIEMLRDAGAICVAGNHERWFLADEMRDLPNATTSLGADARGFLATFPRTRMLSSVGGGVLLCHGVGEDDMATLFPDTQGYALQAVPTLRDVMLDDQVKYMLCGHTHVRMVRTFQGVTVVNAGTLHRDFDPCFAVLDFEQKRVSFHDALDPVVDVEHQDLPDPPPVPLLY